MTHLQYIRRLHEYEKLGSSEKTTLLIEELKDTYIKQLEDELDKIKDAIGIIKNVV